jgi:hypothetical protein
MPAVSEFDKKQTTNIASSASIYLLIIYPPILLTVATSYVYEEVYTGLCVSHELFYIQISKNYLR